MPRAKSGRGGPRQGTAGKAYSNRTDLSVNRAPNTGNTAATGGVAAPAPQRDTVSRSEPAGPTMPSTFPEDTPMLSDPTQRPGEPITAGLPIGAGPGPSAGATMQGQAKQDVGLFKPWLPILSKHADSGSASPGFVRFVRGLRDF